MDINKIYQNNSQAIISELNETLMKIKPEEVKNLIDEMNRAEKIFFVGVGRVGTMLQSVAKRLNHIGYDTYIVGQTTEPPITDKDLLIVASGSGSTLIPVAITKKAKQFNARVFHIGSVRENPISDIVDGFLRIPSKSKKLLEDEVQSCQPMTSLFEQAVLLLGDTITLMVLDMKNEPITEAMWANHANLE